MLSHRPVGLMKLVNSMDDMPKKMLQIIAWSLLLVVCSAFCQEADQESAEVELEEIVVTGIKASLKRSMDIKRDAKGIVAGISQIEMGKFPDANLAESLQRVSGIAIERARGEGTEITVRGFGPRFNLVTFNGRQMATSGGRSFDFGNIASEGISAVEVYKSSRANVPTGGIGAVVNVKTRKPLEMPGLNAVMVAEGIYDPGTRNGEKFTPELVGSFSQTLAQDRFGVALSLSSSKRDGGDQNVTTQDFWGQQFVSAKDVESGALDENGNVKARSGHIIVGDETALNFPTRVLEGIYSMPTNVQYNLDDFTRERVNAQLTFQWRPVDNLTGTIDYTYAENKSDTRHQDMSAWLGTNCPTRESEWIQEGNIWSPTTYTNVGCANDNLQGVGLFGVRDELEALGLQIEWQPTEKLTLTMDYQNSTDHSRPNSKHGSSNFVAVSALNRITTSAHFGPTGIPVLEVELGERNTPHNQIIRRDPFDVGDMQLTGSSFNSEVKQMEIEQLQFDGEFLFEQGHSIKFGAGRIEVVNRGQSKGINRGGNAWSGLGRPGDIADILTIDTISGVFSGVEGGDDTRQRMEFVNWDFQEMIDVGEQFLRDGSHVLSLNEPGPCLTGFCPSYDFDTDEVSTETSNSIYLQLHWVDELFDRPVNLYAGLRYEDTEVHSEAKVPAYSRIEWNISADRYQLFRSQDADGDVIGQFSEIDGAYSMLLPSLDFDIELTEDLMFRASAGISVSRPEYNDIKGAMNIYSFSNEGGFGGRGNPQLLPIEATNFDVSLEWYYAEESYVSAMFWTKDVDNFIVSAKFENQPLFKDLHDPYGGSLYQQAYEELTGGDPRFGVSSRELNNYFVEVLANEQNVVIQEGTNGLEATVTGIAGDPLALFQLNIPINSPDRNTSVTGWDFELKHVFGDSGIGLSANYTIVKGDLEYDLGQLAEQWVVDGQSNTADLVAFYDKQPWEVRLSWNWRDQYLKSAGENPVFVERYHQLDANVTYQLNENMSFYFEGKNLMEQNRRDHGRSVYQLRYFGLGHARYHFGARYKF